MKIHFDNTQTVTFTGEELELIIKNLARIRALVERPEFQPNHHISIYDSDIPLLHALLTPEPHRRW